MKTIGILTGDPELEDYVSKVGKREKFYPSSKWFARLNDSVVLYLNEKKSNKYNFVKITPEMIDNSIFNTIDFLFYNFLDPVAAKIISDELYNKIVNIINKHPTKVYPPPTFANLIADKCKYYKFLENKNIPIVPFFCITKKEYNKKTEKGDDKLKLKRYVEQIHNQTKAYKWKQFIAKPILGTSGRGFKMFDTENNVSVHEIKRQMGLQMDKVFNKYNFPKLLYQEAHPEFGEGLRPEVKMYYVGRTFVYGWIKDKEDPS